MKEISLSMIMDTGIERVKMKTLSAASSFSWVVNEVDPSRLWMKREISEKLKEISRSLVSSS